MSRDDTAHDAPTRREYVKYGGVVVGGGLLAGCAGGDGPDPAATTTETATEHTSEPTATDASYSVTIEPVGEVTFDTPPESWMAINGPWADAAIALGQREGFRPYGGYAPLYYYEELGVSMPDSYVNPHIQIDKEVFYEKDPDVILTDPKLFETVTDSWDESDTEEITRNVAPFFGSTVFRKFPFHTYRFYDLYEAFEKLASVFEQRARYEAFRSVHDDLLATIEERRPTDEASIGLLNAGSSPANGSFFAMDPTADGSEMKQYRDLGVESALPEEFVAADQIDYEQLLEADPDIIVFHSAVGLTDDGGFSVQQFEEKFVRPMEEDSIGSQLTAVTEGRVYPGGHYQQGPIAHLFQTELAARQLYPDEFGAFDPERFPSPPEPEQLFDRGRVADIIDEDS